VEGDVEFAELGAEVLRQPAVLEFAPKLLD
jgi:hypothetical protein